MDARLMLRRQAEGAPVWLTWGRLTSEAPGIKLADAGGCSPMLNPCLYRFSLAMRYMRTDNGVYFGPVVVTGAAGFIGMHVCERLLARGERVVGIDAVTPYYDPALKRARLRRSSMRLSHSTRSILQTSLR